MYEKLIECLNEVGVQVDITQKDIDLREYNMDSFTFIAFIVCVEEKLSITIPDEYLVYDNIQSLKGFSTMLEIIVVENQDKH